MWKCSNAQSSVTLWVQRNIHSRCLQLVWFFAVLLSALPHCRIFSKSTATREWLTCVLDILQFRKKIFKNKKPLWNRETKVLNGHTKRQRPQREKLSVKARHSSIFRPKKLTREYFLAADRGHVYIIKGHKNLIAFISLPLIQK